MSSSMLQPSWTKALLLALALTQPAPAAADAAEAVLAGVNAERAKAGCAPLKVNSRLVAAARAHAKAMAEQNFFGHTGKDGSKSGNRIRRQGYSFRAAAENIAAGQESVSQVLGNWLGSPGHRRNILNCRLKETGIAVVYQPDDRPIQGQSRPFRYYWVQVFAAPK